jgi:hypothetical protein
MSLYHPRGPQHVGPDGLNPVPGTNILRPSVEANRVSDLCTGTAVPSGVRERILAWLGEGAREVVWALCSLPRERWAESPPEQLSVWPALRHARHLALREAHLTLPTVRHALGEPPTDPLPSVVELDRVDSAWDAAAAIESAEAIVRGLGETRFELLQCLEAAPVEVWERPVVATDISELHDADHVALDWLMLHARQHELEHLAAIWRVALNWDRVPAASGTLHRVSLHPADRFS